MTASIEDYIALNALAAYELRIQKEVSIILLTYYVGSYLEGLRKTRKSQDNWCLVSHCYANLFGTKCRQSDTNNIFPFSPHSPIYSVIINKYRNISY
jgi:hypothetical protein